MSDLNVQLTGERELNVRFEEFPHAAYRRITDRMTSLVSRVKAAAEQLAPVKTGQLQSEITGRVFTDNPTRVAGYVSVYAPSDPHEYVKAASLEYGVNKPRSPPQRGAAALFSRIMERKHNLDRRAARQVHQRAYRYLRGGLEDVRAAAQIEIEAALTEVTNEGGG